MVQTPEQYYENEDLHGLYQYVTLKDIIDRMMAEIESDEDHYLKNTKRSLIIQYAKDAIREVSRQAANDVLAFEITVPESLVWPLPQDYVNYCRISLVDIDPETNSYRIYPLTVNREINMAIGYLQDNNGDLLFDNNGQILMAESLNAIAKPYRRYKLFQNVDSFQKSQFGELNIDRKRIVFSSDLSNKEVVIEYLSDGLQANLSESEITVHKYLRKTIEKYIYHACIERRRNVPANEKNFARIAYNTALHESKMSLSGLNLREIARAVRGGNVLP